VHAGGEEVTIPHTHSRTDAVVRVLGGVVSAGSGALWLLGVFTVVASRLSNDPHGYGLIFGSMFTLVTGLVFTVALPFTFPRQHRLRVGRIAIATYVVTTALLFALWFSAS
jgi:hypothetical protein